MSTTTVERTNDVWDWFGSSKRELPLHGVIYEFQYRFTCTWWLEGQRYDDDVNRWVPTIYTGFQLTKPAEALAALGENVVRFTAVNHRNYHQALAKLLADAETIKKRQEASV